MIDLILYSIDDGDNVINKKLNNGVNIPIKLKQNFDILNPEIILVGDYHSFNYAKIPSLNRYYFINNKEQLNNSIIKLNLVCDVLETYKNEILNSLARFKRNIKDGDFENISLDYSNKIISTKYTSKTKPEIKNSIILTVVGV